MRNSVNGRIPELFFGSFWCDFDSVRTLSLKFCVMVIMLVVVIDGST